MGIRTEIPGGLSHVMVVLSDGVFNRCDPLGARCAMSALESTGQKFLGLYEDRIISRQEINSKIAAHQPDIIWVSVQPDTGGISQFAHQLSRTAADIVFGNVGSRFLGLSDFRGFSDRVYIVLGQGEDAIVALANCMRNGRIVRNLDRLRCIPNLRFFWGAESIDTASRPSLLAKNLVPSKRFLKSAVKRGDVLTARSSSGCAASCVFCTVKAINNRQGWQGCKTDALREWLQCIVNAGRHSGKIGLVDDDLAGSLDNLHVVASEFRAINRRNGTRLKFGFSTRAVHLVNPKDTEAQKKTRRDVWEFVAASGLDGVFVGLESGSAKQLKRLGKGYPAEMNFTAVSFAKQLSIDLEIGFIPVDPMMSDDLWRIEMRDNIRLARYCDVAKRSPTWLAPARVYRESPLEKWMSRLNLLGPEIPETGEYEVRYKSEQVVQFIKDLGPCFCYGADNNFYRFKRELKYVQRYPPLGLREIDMLGRELIDRELEFVSNLVNTLNRNGISALQIEFAETAITILGRIKRLLTGSTDAYAVEIRRSVIEAAASIESWRQSIVSRKHLLPLKRYYSLRTGIQTAVANNYELQL